MPRRRRVIVADKPYEVVPRARDCLPLPPNKTTNTIRLGIFGRAQRDDKVTLCNLVCMNSHDHMQVVPRKPKDLPLFYGEILKKTTDSLRALTGNRSLRIWEDRVSVIMLASLESAIDRLVYLFCNPAKARLCDSIDSYRGISSWKAFCSCEATVEARVELKVLWHRVEDLPQIGTKGLKRADDTRYHAMLCSSTTGVEHTLVFEPFGWLKCFGITDPAEIEKIRQIVIRRVRAEESKFREERYTKRGGFFCPDTLESQPHLKPHTPKKKERKIFVICGDKDERISWIAFFDAVDERCRACYERAKSGAEARWPPGTFMPWLPPRECYVY